MNKKKVVALNAERILTKNHLPSGLAFDEGVIMLVNKPLTWTSFDVVNRIKYTIKYNTNYKKVKVGHAGTLDPMADGLLIVCTGKYTKLLEGLSGNEKSYKAIIKLGATTPSFDRESEEENITNIDHLSKEEIFSVKDEFSGTFQQMPPIFSAIKIKGQTAYKVARRGEDIVMKTREVTISQFEFTDVSLPLVSLDVTVSKGTYIRSLANDIGKSLKVGGYLHGLTRTSIAEYKLSDALEVEEVVEFIKANYTREVVKEIA